MMYEKDEDDNIGAEWRMAKEIFKTPPQRGVANRPHPINNPIIKPLSDTIIDEGAKQFAGHEDVMAKILGRV